MQCPEIKFKKLQFQTADAEKSRPVVETGNILDQHGSKESSEFALVIFVKQENPKRVGGSRYEYPRQL